MIEVNALLFTLLAEGAGLLSLILIIWIVLSVRKKGKDKAAAQALVKSIKANSDDRLAAIKTFLIQSAGLEGEELQLDVKKLDRLEKDFFTQLVRLYIKKDGDILSGIDKQFDKVISAYKSHMSNTAVEDTKTDDENVGKIESLQKEKEALKIELQITKATMGNMMTEFNTMFNGGNETVQTSKEALQSSMTQVEDVPEDTGDSAVVAEAIVETQDEVPAAAVESSAPEATVNENDIDDILFEQEAAAEPEAIETQADTPATIDSSGMEDVFFSTDDEPEPSAPTSIKESDEDFGEIVSSDDVDDLLDGIDLSKEIDMK